MKKPMMKQMLILGTLLVILACTRAERNVLSAGNDKIVGGSEVKSTDSVYAPIVQINQIVSQTTDANGNVFENMLSCTGTLIEPTVVVTAAHCFAPNGKVEVSKGINTDTSDDTVVASVRVIHQNYNNSTGFDPHYDIAVLFLPRGLSDAMPMPISKSDVTPGSSYTVAGYGVHSYPAQGGEQSSDAADTIYNLKQVTLTDVGDMQVDQTESALAQAVDAGAGHGDSGGPVFALNKGQPEIVGITSRLVYLSTSDGSGKVIQEDSFPSHLIFTKIAPFMPWIEAQKKAYLQSSLAK